MDNRENSKKRQKIRKNELEEFRGVRHQREKGARMR